MASFIPRTAFPSQLSLPRSYFLGHHASGLSKMKTMLSSIDLIIECRDYRVPLTSRNPLFEQSLAGRERLVVYTKRDLGSRDRGSDRRVRCFPLYFYSISIKRNYFANYCRGKRLSDAGTSQTQPSSQTTKANAT
jgi:ribosome biogenesis GTPase A